jgi:RimJ/RimL family protein N-acetyltransferase
VGHLPWLRGKTSVELSEGFRAIEALDSRRPFFCFACNREHGSIVGMVGYNGWTQNSCAMHVAVEHPGVVRALLRPAFDYAFNHKKLKLVLGITPGDNSTALRFNRHLGFSEVHRVKDGWGDGIDLVVQELRRDACRWL